MKKKLSFIAAIFMFVFTNVNAFGNKLDGNPAVCHFNACQAVAQYEAFAPDASSEEVEYIYQEVYYDCLFN